MHAEISGTVDFREANDESCLKRLRSLVDKLGGPAKAPFSVTNYDSATDAPLYAAEDLYGLLDPAPGASNVYDMREVIARIVDRSEFDEYKQEFGRTLICGYARIGGRAVGIVANQKLNQAQTVAMGPQAGSKRIEVGGVIYTDGAQKAARFIMDCNQGLVPLIFLHDVNGFMVGKDAEWSGIIRAGAKMVSAVSTSVVPKITVIVGGSFGAGHYAMCGKAFDPRFLFAWPTARYAVMGGSAAANTLAEVKGSADGAVGRGGGRGTQTGDLAGDQGRLRCGGGPALRRGAALDRCNYRSGEDARGVDAGARSMLAEPGRAEVQCGGDADMISQKTIVSLLLAILLAILIKAITLREVGPCAAYQAGQRNAPATAVVNPQGREYQVPCDSRSQWFLRQTRPVQALTMLDGLVVVVFLFSAYVDVTQRRTML